MRRVLVALYRMTARVVLPAGFRTDYGATLVHTVEERLRDARGPLGILRASLAELVDLVRTATREWWATIGQWRSGRATTRERGVRRMGGAWNDLRTSARSLARRPSLALGVILTIGLGIGATTTIYGVVDAVLLRPLPFDDPGSLVAVGAVDDRRAADPETGRVELKDMSSEVFKRYRERARSFTTLGALSRERLEAEALDGPLTVAGVGPELFALLGASPALGRTFTPGEYDWRADPVAVISYDHWQRRYGGDPDVLGRPLESAPGQGTARSIIVGVLEKGFEPPEAFFASGALPEIYAPLPFADPGMGPRGRIIIDFSMKAVGRLRPGVTLEQARAEADRLYDEIEVELADRSAPSGTRRGIGIDDLHVQTVGASGRMLWVFLGAAGLLLVLTSMNAATLLLARALDRTQELGVRVALGAGRGGIVRLVVAEAALLATIGGVLGIVLAHGGVATFLRYAPSTIPRLRAVDVDGRVLAVAAGTTLLTALAAALLPALRLGARAPWQRLQSGGRAASESASGLRTTLVGGQLALSVVLLSVAGLLFSSFVRLRAVDPGFEAKGLVAVAAVTSRPEQISRGGCISETRLCGSEAIARRWDRVLEAVAALPGVTAVAAADALPFQPPMWAPTLHLQGDAPDVVRQGIAGYVVSPGYLGTLGSRVLEGRGIEATDGPDAEPVVVVNEAFAREHLGGGEAVGALITRRAEGGGGRAVTMRVVGVVEDVLQARAEDGPRAAIYVPHRQADISLLTSFMTVVRTSLTPQALAPGLARALAATDRHPRSVETMERRMARTRATPRFQTALIGAFAAVATLLAAVGLHGSLSHMVRRRRRELGVRVALGADRASLLRMVLGQGLRVALTGLALGLVGTLALSRVLAGFLFGMTPHDPGTLLVVSGVLTLVAVIACLTPARAATAVDPVSVLNSE
jgi:putative ABC transport system permease protein